MDKLVIGCGYLGRRIAQRWLALGHRVFATTRTKQYAKDLDKLGLRAVAVDVAAPGILRIMEPVDTIVYCVGNDRAAGSSMRAIHVDGLANVLRSLPRFERLIHVSSTGVYGRGAGDDVDETAPPQPVDESGKIVLEAEKTLHRRVPNAVILRLAGIYGPGRLIRSQALLAGEPIAADPDQWLNLIHVDDGALAVLAAEAHGGAGQVYNVSDGEPVPRRDFYQMLAQLLGAPPPHFAPGEAARGRDRGNRRILNRRLREELGVQLLYPSYREGLPASIGKRPE